MKEEKIKALLAEALQLMKADRYPEAYQVLAEAYVLDPNDELVQQGLVLIDERIQEGNYDFRPETAEQYTMRGIARGRKGEHHAAIQDFDDAIRLDNECHLAYCSKGYTLHLMGQFNEAIDNFQTAISIEPGRGDYHDKLADSYEAIGDIENAIRSNHAAITVQPDVATFYFNYAVTIMHHLQAWEEALNLLDKAIELWPEYEDARVNREYVLKQLKRS